MDHKLAESILRRTVRLLNAVLQLHKTGFQNLAVEIRLPQNKTQWTVRLHAYENIALEAEGALRELNTSAHEKAVHIAGATGNLYFGWNDGAGCNAYQLAELIKTRFPRLLELSRGQNPHYSGWLCAAIGRIENGQDPDLDPMSREEATLIGPVSAFRLIGEQATIIREAPHFNETLHEGYREIINSWRKPGIKILPSPPSDNHDLFSHGAYWEGAVWYIREVLGFTNLIRFIEAHEADNRSEEDWSIFYAVWNSNGQLCHLIALFKRFAVGSNTVSKSQKCAYQNDLDVYERLCTPHQTNIPNPYSGGGNPLHLSISDLFH